MRIEIMGFYGYGNAGDEAILQSIMDELGDEHEYVISTPLPHTLFERYWNVLQNGAITRNKNVVEIRVYEDYRWDCDAYILGGGGLNWGLGWRQCLSMFAHDIKCMNYAVDYNRKVYYSEKLYKLYFEFLKHFKKITVRDMHSANLLKEVGSVGDIDGELDIVTTFDPGVLLIEEKFDCPEGKVVVFPRYEDNYAGGNNQIQLDWLIRDMLENSIRPRDIIFVPCAPRNADGVPIDLELCQYLHKRIEGSILMEISPFEPRKMKYLIGKSKLIYSGGRYHPVVWAIGCGVPFKMAPSGFAYTKNMSVMDMFRSYGRDGLIKLAKLNKKIFDDMIKGV
jgi:polysaccharide pyruvyl transferase WcaK-like protein